MGSLAIFTFPVLDLIPVAGSAPLPAGARPTASTSARCWPPPGPACTRARLIHVTYNNFMKHLTIYTFRRIVLLDFRVMYCVYPDENLLSVTRR